MSGRLSVPMSRSEPPVVAPVTTDSVSDDQRIAELTAEVATLRKQVADLEATTTEEAKR